MRTFDNFPERPKAELQGRSPKPPFDDAIYRLALLFANPRADLTILRTCETNLAMNKLGTYIVTFLLTAIAPLPTVAAEDAKTAIEKLLNTYQERLSMSDIEGILDLYSANPVFIPEYAPPAVGRDSVHKAYEWVFATLKLRGQFAFHDVEVIGNTAWVRTTSTGHFRVMATGAEGDVANSELFVLKLEGGVWKMHRYIFTSSAPPGQK
jgi:ketosteroid isomerase-like protein